MSNLPIERKENNIDKSLLLRHYKQPDTDSDDNSDSDGGDSTKNKTIKDGDIAPWKGFKKEKRKRNQIRPYFEMGRIVKRLHFLR